MKISADKSPQFPSNFNSVLCQDPITHNAERYLLLAEKLVNKLRHWVHHVAQNDTYPLGCKL